MPHFQKRPWVCPLQNIFDVLHCNGCSLHISEIVEEPCQFCCDKLDMHSPWQRACLCKKCRILHVHKEQMPLVFDSAFCILHNGLTCCRLQDYCRCSHCPLSLQHSSWLLTTLLTTLLPIENRCCTRFIFVACHVIQSISVSWAPRLWLTACKNCRRL